MKRCHSVANNGERDFRPAKRYRGGYQNTRSMIKKNLGNSDTEGSGLMGALLGGLTGGGGGLGEIFQGLLGGGDDVTHEHNHIYFKTDVTMDSIKKLTDIIDDANREYERQVIDNTANFQFPKPIYLHITSNGGDLFGGFLAYDAIRNSKVPIYTVVDGYAVSSGSIMFMAGKKRFMNPNSYILIHQLSQTIQGTQTNSDVMDDAANNIELMTRLYQIYLTEFHYAYDPVPEENVLTKSLLEQHMNHDIYWNFETCFKYGLAEGIYSNYQVREEIDRREFYSNLTNGKTQLPTYAEVTGSFEQGHQIVFGDRSAFTPGPEIQERINVLVRKNGDTRKTVEDSLQQSVLGHLLNAIEQPESPGESNDAQSGESAQSGVDPNTLVGVEALMNLNEAPVINIEDSNNNDVRVIGTRRSTRNSTRQRKYSDDGSDYIPSDSSSDSD